MDLPALRKRNGRDWSQADLARELGVSPGYVGDLENGRRHLTIPLAVKLERATGETGLVEIVASEIAARVPKRPRKAKRRVA